MEEKWMVHSKKADFYNEAEKHKISPFLARIIRNRDVLGEEVPGYLRGTIEELNSPWLMKDMEKAIDIIIEKIRNKKRIRIIGDYDIDGICSSFILADGLEQLGALTDCDIPDRINDGYGINKNIIHLAWEEGVDTIITCDNGISAMEEIQYAKELGLTVIVTDHHNVPFVQSGDKTEFLIPQADAVINPKQEICTYPFKELCGAGVAYKLLEALYEKMELKKEQVYPYLEYAAIATVGDVVTLLNENRIITRYGLKLLNQTRNLGLKALIEVNQLKDKEITSYHIGFILGPCLNSSGRLSTAKQALALFREKDTKIALQMALELKELNGQRKELTMQALEQAVEEIETSAIKEDKILVVYLPHCHESIAGITAGRLKEKYYKPAIVLTKAESGVKGSGRSIEAYNMFEGLSGCAHLLTRFGGHALAAGLSLEEKYIEQLRRELNQNTGLCSEDLQKKIWIDIPLPIEYVNEAFIDELSLLEPFGKDNEKPVFAEKNLKVERLQILGKMRNVLKFELKNSSNKRITAIAFDYEEKVLSYLAGKFGEKEMEKAKKGLCENMNLSIIYYPQINEYMGKREVRIVIKHIS